MDVLIIGLGLLCLILVDLYLFDITPRNVKLKHCKWPWVMLPGSGFFVYYKSKKY